MNTTKTTQAGRDYMLGFGLSMMIGYPVVLIASLWLLREYPDAWWRFLAAVAPVVPILFGLRTFLRFLNRIDELQQRIQLNAVGFAAGATAMITVTYGFLENVGFPQLSWIWIFPMIVLLWGGALAFYNRRYA